MLCRCGGISRIALIMHSKDKMEKAWALLKDGKKKIGTIAIELGYSRMSHFSQAFKMYYRCTPSEIRKLLTANEDFEKKMEWLSAREVKRLKKEWEGVYDI